MADTRPQDDYVVSEKLCPAFMRWALCYRERNGGCPDVHDWDTRKDIAALNKVRREEAQKQKRLADEKVREQAHREKLQRQYDNKLKTTKATKVDNTDKSKPIMPETASSNNSKSTVVKSELTAVVLLTSGTSQDIKTHPVENNAPAKGTNVPKKKKKKSAKRSKPVKDSSTDQTTKTTSVEPVKIATTGDVNTSNTKSDQTEVAKSINNGKHVNGKPAKTGKSVFSNKNEKFAASRIHFQKFYNENKNGEVPADGIALPRAVFHAPTPPSSDAGNDVATKYSKLPKYEGHSGLVFHLSSPESEVDSADVPVIKNGILTLPRQNSSVINKPHCNRFLRSKGGCKRQDCPDLHDYNHRIRVRMERKKELASHKAEAVPKAFVHMPHANLDTYDDNSTAVATYAGVASKDIAMRLPPITQVAPEKNAWEEKTSDLELWARANVRDKAQFMLLTPFFSSDALPSNFSAGYGNSNLAIDGLVFELFPLLPGELRNKIWFHAIADQVLQPHNVRIGWVELQNGNLFGDGIVSKNFAPSILNVNSECRSLALPYFKRTFKCKGYYTYFNYDIDRLYIHTTGPEQLQTIVGLISCRNLERIKDLTLSVKEFARDHTEYKEEFCDQVTKFKNLEHLTLLIGDGVEDAYWFQTARVLRRASYCLDIGYKTRWGKEDVPPPKLRVKRIPAVYAHSLMIDELIYL